MNIVYNVLYSDYGLRLVQNMLEKYSHLLQERH